MSLAAQVTLDFQNLAAPVSHGDVLVEPVPSAWMGAAEANHRALGESKRPLSSDTLSAWRRRTRERILGTDSALVIVTGHQPAFVHAGVWAKHIAAARMAVAADGIAVNLVVDNDAAHGTMVPVPHVDGERVSVRQVQFADLCAGCAYDQIERQSPEATVRFEQAMRKAWGDRYDTSQLPAFFRGFRATENAADWVDQAVGGRRAIEADFGIALEDRRVSRVWGGPLLADLLLRSCAFAASYNAALAIYRRENRIRGSHRPIPDLSVDGDTCEVPLWAYRPGEPRRRLFVRDEGTRVQLVAGDEPIGDLAKAELSSCDDIDAPPTQLNGWRLRPRALTLTLWARLLLADLFVHGIGGAKYDRISDRIIEDYYGLTPPQMVCVSATLRLDLPCGDATPAFIAKSRHALRDLRFNPQRHLPGGSDLAEVVARRQAAVTRSDQLRASKTRDRRLRRQAFLDIRRASQAILDQRPQAVAAMRSAFEAQRDELEQNRIAQDRAYFFGLFDRHRLEELLTALPDERGFRI